MEDTIADLVGKTLSNRYHVVEFLGRGGMAEVYKIWDSDRMIHMAAKVLLKSLAMDKIFLRRFQREADALAGLQHPNIVRFYGMAREESLAFMLLDFIEGTTLQEVIFNQGAGIDPNQILSIIRPICSALHYAHRQGMVHCDIKPGNIMINQQGQALLTDFGIARMTDAATATMVGFGTPAYMAPELILGQDPTPASDIYSLGIVLFEMVTGGERPFTGERAPITGPISEKVRWEQVNLTPPAPRSVNPNITPALETVILKCLAKAPEKRYASTLEFANALEIALENFLYTPVNKSPQPQITVPQHPKSTAYRPQRIAEPERYQPAGLPDIKKPGDKWLFALGLIIIPLVIVLILQLTRGKTTISSQPPPNNAAGFQSIAESPTQRILKTSGRLEELYQFEIVFSEVIIYIEEDGSLSLNYVYDFDIDPSSEPIQYIDISLPSESFDLKSIQADVDNQPITQIEKSPFVNNGIALDLDSNAIQPGESGLVNLWISDIQNVLNPIYQGGQDNYIGISFTPNYFSTQYDLSVSTEYAVTVVLPPGVSEEEGIYYLPNNWPGQSGPKDIGRTADGRVYYYWFTDNADLHSKYTFGASFPAEYVSEDKQAIELTHTQAITPTDTMRLTAKDDADLVFVDAGWFLMGSEEQDAWDNEKPEHSVYLDSYWIYKYEVTNQQFAAFVDATGYQTTAEQAGESWVFTGTKWEEINAANWSAPRGPGSNIQSLDNHPVVHMSWYDASAYCAWAGGRLPTEAEWEKAASSQENLKYPWGDAAPNCSLANYKGCIGGTKPVGQYPAGASPYGALDMVGNVWEWTADWYSNTYYNVSPDTNPQGPPDGTHRVLRGGSWASTTSELPVSGRFRNLPTYTDDNDGFRCVIDANN